MDVHIDSRNFIGIGYQGRDLTTVIDALQAAGVEYLVDVRLTPISRKRGLSKTALREAVTAAGIGYEHLPALGNPKHNRPGFAGDDRQLREAREVYRGLLSDPRAQEALLALIERSHQSKIGLLCFEADEERCHRQVILNELAAISASAVKANTPPGH